MVLNLGSSVTRVVLLGHTLSSIRPPRGGLCNALVPRGSVIEKPIEL